MTIQARQTRSTARVLGYRGFQVVGLVRERIKSEGQAPSYRMICDELGIGTKGEVAQIVQRLERRGLLRRVGQGKVRRIALP